MNEPPQDLWIDEPEALWVLRDPHRPGYSPEEWAAAAWYLGDVLFNLAAHLGSSAPNDALLFALRDASERARIAAERAEKGEAV
jgi:hypothetical protein